MSNEMSVEEKARGYSYKETCMDSIIEKLTMDELDHVTKLQISAYISGHQSRDEEVKELKEVILEVVRIVEEYPDFFNMGDNIHSCYFEHLKLIERLKQERVDE